MVKNRKIAVLGLGYVGLPVALAFAEKYEVTGYDPDPSRIRDLTNGLDKNKEVSPSELGASALRYTSDPEALADSHVFIIAVPTPVDENKVPELEPLKEASRIVGQVLKKGDMVVFESTVYPGCTEEICLPIVQRLSGLSPGEDLKLGYSPERINPGDRQRRFTNIIKVVSGNDEEALSSIAELYESVVNAGIFRASSIKVAEAAKIIENTQRDVNIALMNELAMIFDKLDISTHDVLEAAGTKWNFLKFYPGLVGGHCIDVDPYYLTYKAMQLGYTPDVILSGRGVNKTIPKFIAHKVVRHLVAGGKALAEARILIMGLTFKENVNDYRNSRVFDLIAELETFGTSVEVYDPHVDVRDPALSEISVIEKPDGIYDAIIVAVAHDEFRIESFGEWGESMARDVILFDVKNMYHKLDKPGGMRYFVL